MATVFSQIKILQRKNRKLKFTKEEKIELGRIVNEDCRTRYPHDGALQKVPSNEPEGLCLAVSYPRKYIPRIHELIINFHKKIPPVTSHRKRIDTPRRPVFSTKIQPKN